MPTYETPVLIAGGGPVGVTLAMDLARQGVECIVLERRKELPPNPRCNTTNARSMELFRRLGCADAVRAAGLPGDHNTDVVYMTRFNEHELARYKRPTPHDVLNGTQAGVAANWPTPEPQHFISQIYLEPVLRHHAREHFGISLWEGWELVSFDQDDEGVTGIARETYTGEERNIRARYLVGTDGSGSRVRTAIGARLTGVSRLSDTCSTLFRSRRVAEIAKGSPGWMWRFINGGVLVAIDGDDLFLVHNGVPAGEDPMTFDPESRMFDVVGEPFEYEVVHRARWTARAMVASRFRRGRVFLAGDAAHLWVPMGGFGMNAGIADAVSLSWRLAGNVQGWADDKLLDTYELERAPIGSSVASQAMQWAVDVGRTMSATPQERAELESDEQARQLWGERVSEATLSEFECAGFQLGFRYTDSPVICHDELTPPPAITVMDYVASSLPGMRLPHVWRSDGASIFDQLGTGFTLLRVGQNPPFGTAIIEAAQALDVPLDVLEVPDPVAIEAYEGMGLILVRPDQHIAWRSRDEPDGEQAAQVLGRVTGRLVPVAEPQRLKPTRLISTMEGDLIDVNANQILDQLEQVARLSVVMDNDGAGNAFVVEKEPTNSGTQIVRRAADGSSNVVSDEIDDIADIVVSADSQMLRVALGNGDIVQLRLDESGRGGAARPFAEEPSFRKISAVTGDSSNGVWVCDAASNLLTRLDNAGRATHVVAIPSGSPQAAILDPDETRLYFLTIEEEEAPTSIWAVDLPQAN